MFEYAHRQTFLARVRRRSIQFIRWSPVLIVALLLRNWSESFEAFHSWTGLTLDYPGEYRLDRHIELTVLGLLLLGLGVRWRVCPPWRTLLSASFRQWSTLALAYLLILALAIFITNDRAFFNDFRPIDPMDQPRAWWIFLATLLLGAWQQEIWGRAILQSTLRRMVDCRWIAIVLNAVLLSIDQPGHRADTFCLAILLGIVFTHTRSLVCTTAIHLVVDLSLDVLQGGTFMEAGWLKPNELLSVRALSLLGLLLLALIVERQHRPASHRTRPLRTMVQTLMLIVLAIAIRRAAGWLCAPLWETLIDCNEWLTRTAVTHLDLLVQAGVAVTVLAWLRCGPPLRELFAVRPRTTLGLLAAGASLPVLATVIALPDAFRSGHLAPLSPMSWQFWLGGVMPLAAAALHEELLHRALFLPLFNRLLLNEWAGAVASALLFAAVHPPERAIAVFPAGLLLAVVYLRTRSIVCTTVLHLAMNISLSTITGTDFTHSRFIASEVFVGARPLFGAVIFAFAVMFEWGWRRSVDGREPRLTHPPNERAGTAFPERTSV